MTSWPVEVQSALALGSFGSGIAALLSLLALHIVSPEFQPSWRMVSEYALGEHKWLITTFFLAWGISSLLLAFSLWPTVETGWARVGVLLLAVSGVGELMGGLFDLNHAGHGLAALLGVPTLPIAALLLAYHLVTLHGWIDNRGMFLLLSHSTWISLVLMAVAMGVMMAGFKAAGLPMGPGLPAPDRVPDGVIALAGYANRWLVVCYIAWVLVVSRRLFTLT